MKCREARHLIYLYREGEIPEETRRLVLEHAGSCRRCAGELQQAGRTQLFVADLGGVEPHVQAPRDLTDEIMRAVELSGAGKHSTRTLKGIPFRRLQVACTWAAAAIVAIFFIQTSNDFYRITTLEARLSQQPPAPSATSGEIPLAAVGLTTISKVGRLLTQSPAAYNTDFYGRFELEKAVRSFFDVVQEGPSGFAVEVQRLRTRYPDLWLISPLDGLTSRDRVILSQQGKSLMRDLRTLLQPGRSDYEK